MATVGEDDVARLKLVATAWMTGEIAVAAQLDEPAGVAVVARAVQADKAAASRDPLLERGALRWRVEIAGRIGEDDDVESGERFGG